MASLAALENKPLDGPLGPHGHAGMPPKLSGHTPTSVPARLVSEVRAAAATACSLATPEAARRAGYVLSSPFTQGVGTHWTNWRLVDKPFDPARPAMLLYATRAGRETLVGFSYWLRTPDAAEPAGFSGTQDHWHQHFGLCFDPAGMLERENVRSAKLCAGSWLNGKDLWMLHAWIVPGHANTSGLFAPLNGELCSRTAPDIMRCPRIG